MVTCCWNRRKQQRQFTKFISFKRL